MRREPISGNGCGRTGFTILAVLSMTLSGIGGEQVQTAATRNVAAKESAVAEFGVASFYAERYHGKPTASGEVFDMRALTAAHRSHKFGTKVKVTHLGNSRAVTVRINDRGPFVPGRLIDLSRAAAEELHMAESGLARVKLEIVE
jgi:rare lipoprotein A